MKISQNEARQLKRRVQQLESLERERRMRYARDYPGGVNIAHTTYASGTEFLPAVITNSRQLGHAVVCVADGNVVRYYAIPHPEQPA
jgi:hypothetical protein